MEISVRNRIYLTLAIFILAASGLGYFVVYPAIASIMETAANMRETRVAIEKKYLSGQYLRRANQDVEKARESAKKLSNIFIFSGEEYLFLPELEKQMTDLEYNISNTNLAESETDNKKTPSDTLDLSFTIQGDFPTLMKALAILRQTEHYINIDQAAFQLLDNNSIQLNVKARVYRINPDKIKDIIDESEKKL